MGKADIISTGRIEFIRHALVTEITLPGAPDFLTVFFNGTSEALRWQVDIGPVGKP